MFKMIEGLPQNVLAIEATGKFTHEDYQHTLIPRAAAKIAASLRSARSDAANGLPPESAEPQHLQPRGGNRSGPSPQPRDKRSAV